MKLLMSGITAILLTGCAAQPIAFTDIAPAAQITSFTLDDARPAIEKEREMLSYSITNCNYGIIRMGDADTTPDKINILKHDLNELASNALKGKTVVVENYTIYSNGAVALRGMMNNMTGGSSQGLIAKGMINIGCKKEEVKGGWYDPSEVTTNQSPLIVDLTLTVDGRKYTTHIVKSPEMLLTKENQTPFIRSVLLKTAENIALQLK